MPKLKYTRLAISLAIFIILSLAFLGIPAITPSWFLLELGTYFQFLPSLLKFISLLSILCTGFVLVIVLTFLFGRVYCSTICPLGTFQDVIIRIAARYRKRKIFRFSKPQNILRYTGLGIIIISLSSGSILLINLLDPFSNFGKIVSSIFRPLAILINDSLVWLLERIEIYWISPVGIRDYCWLCFVFPLLFLVVIVVMSAKRGRLFCNTICPVGSFLSIISKYSFFKIAISVPACTRCGKCSTACKAECIDLKQQKVDFTRCVGCFNCLQVCPEKGINYQIAFKKKELSPNDKKKNEPSNRRQFFTSSIVLATALIWVNEKAKANKAVAINDGKPVDIIKKVPVSPPGSYSIENFNNHCTACYLCVSTCPTQVLQPSKLEYGLAGLLQPHMKFDNSFCNYECVKCSEVCPTGAIIPITIEKKKSIQTGKVVFLKQNCVVTTEETSCGACSEHCPTKAVHMVPYKGTLTIPETDINICVGCGACEYACPAKPYKAIYVEGNLVHKTAFKPLEKKLKEEIPQEFPF